MTHNHALDPVIPDPLAFAPVDAGLPSRRTHWRRLADDRQATVVGLPNFSGLVTATDGVLALMRTNDGREVVVHLESVEWPRAKGESAQGVRKRKQKEDDKRWMEYV